MRQWHPTFLYPEFSLLTRAKVMCHVEVTWRDFETGFCVLMLTILAKRRAPVILLSFEKDRQSKMLV